MVGVIKSYRLCLYLPSVYFQQDVKTMSILKNVIYKMKVYTRPNLKKSVQGIARCSYQVKDSSPRVEYDKKYRVL